MNELTPISLTRGITVFKRTFSTLCPLIFVELEMLIHS